MSASDDDPHQGHVNTSDFFFPGQQISVLLIHGLSGTPYEMRYLGERLAANGMRVCGVRLAGHVAPPEELGAATSTQWYESVVEGFEHLHQFGDPVVVVGLSMGAVLAARLAEDQGDSVAGVAMLSPAFFLPRPIRVALAILKWLGPIADRVYLRGSESDIHDAAARSIHPATRLMPVSAVFELLKLSAAVRAQLSRVTQPVLILHGRHDHVCPMRKNVRYLMSRLGSPHKRAIVLEESFHVITVDSEKDRVADEVGQFADQFRGRSQPARAIG